MVAPPSSQPGDYEYPVPRAVLGPTSHGVAYILGMAPPGRYEDVCLYNGTASDYAYELINETTEVPEHLSYYIDYDAIARDMKINGEIVEINHDLIVTNSNEF